MYFSYLRRELGGRRKQTVIIAIGMALAIALVIIVNGVSAGVKNAQAKVLQSVYGVGTDMTVTTTATAQSGGFDRQRFNIGAGAGTTSGTKQSVSVSRLTTGPFSTTIASSDVAAIAKVSGVKAAAATLSLESVTFSGTLPNQNRSITFPGSSNRSGGAGQGQAGQGQTGQGQAGQGSSSSGSTTVRVGPSGGADGAGGSAFDINRVSVLGVDPSGSIIGPLSTISLKSGKALTAADNGKYVAVLDSSYATTNKLKVGSTVTLASKSFSVIGIVASTTTDSSSASNIYIPLDVAQKLSGSTGKVSTIYVQANDSTQIDAVAKAIGAKYTKATVKTQSELASSVSGSLGSAATLLDNLGLWLSVAVLIAAFLIAILFTVSGVTRRTREFGTLKALGWSNGRITGQVAGESLVQGLIGGAFGIVLGLVGLVIINVIHPVLSGSASTRTVTGGPGGNMPAGGFGGGGFRAASQATTSVALQAPVTISIIAIAVGLAVVGGLLAGAFGGWRASRLSPAEALRSVN